jgi:hypothetical protein
MTAAAAINSDVRFTITVFPDRYAKSKSERKVTVTELAALIRNTTAPTKARLPWLKLATFGDQRSVKNCLRTDANLLMVHGIEGDYDGEVMAFAEGVSRVSAADILAIVYTSASHTPEKPRWRVLAPFYGPMFPAGRVNFVDILDGVLGGVLAPESHNLSTAFYFGRAGDAPFELVVVDGRPIDMARGLSGRPREAPPRDYSLIGVAADATEPTADGKAALLIAIERILDAADGEQERPLNGMSYFVGRLVGSGQLPSEFALRILLREAVRIPSYNTAAPWHRGEVEQKVKRAVEQGRKRPWASIADLMHELDAAGW